MKFLLNANQQAGDVVVPVHCGSTSGTAFFVSAERLITAFHVIADYVSAQADVWIRVQDKSVACKVDSLEKELDIAILTCVDYHNDMNAPSLLASLFHEGQNLAIIGFPQEIGNGVEWFRVYVRNVKELKQNPGSYDRLVRRVDEVPLSTYQGFSGSPVFNEYGSVIGVVTDRLYRTLGYTSIKRIVPQLRGQGIDVSENDDEEDTTPLGMGWAIRQVEQAVDKAGNRYNRKVQVRNPVFEDRIEDFMGVNSAKKEKALRNEIHKFYWGISPKNKKKLKEDEYKSFIAYKDGGEYSNEVAKCIYEFHYIRDDKDKDCVFKDRERELLGYLQKGLNAYLQCKSFEDQQFLLVKGIAGSGKTHMLCDIAKKVCHKTHVYMMFGTQFQTDELPLDTIVRCANWTNEATLQDLDDEMKKKGRYAVFIIDAINEGVGCHVWKDYLERIKTALKDKRHIKMILSIRVQQDNDILNVTLKDFKSITMTGFEKVEDALKTYLKAYEISANEAELLKVHEFKNPLFLKLFCEYYAGNSYTERALPSIREIYLRYLKRKNEKISIRIDADPLYDYTTRFLTKLAKLSVERYQCDDIPRSLAHKLGNRMCHDRLWSQSLLNNCLKENLLMEYNSNDKENLITFEYDSIGDLLKAINFITSNTDEYEIPKKLLHFYETKNNNPSKIVQFVISVLSLWEPSDKRVWKDPAFTSKNLAEALLVSIPYRMYNGLEIDSEVISSILIKHPRYLNPELILNNMEIYASLIDWVHTHLFAMSLAERDEKWTYRVNLMLDDTDFKHQLEEAEKVCSDLKILSTVYLWLLTASYQGVRAVIIRRLKIVFDKEARLMDSLISNFSGVNDPYILSGLYCAVYGYFLTHRKDKENALTVAKTIQEYCYPKRGEAPNYLEIRFWTLKILKLCKEIHPEAQEFWENSTPPYTSGKGLFCDYAKLSDDAINSNFLGESLGSERIMDSLLQGDFNRYIIGLNSNSVSQEFCYKGKDVPLEDYAKIIACLIKNKYGWNDSLGSLDNNIGYQSRMTHTKERLGKKYQWMGYNELYAFLLDTCELRTEKGAVKDKDVKTKNYPWLLRRTFDFDPTLTEENAAMVFTREHFCDIPKSLNIDCSYKEWLEDPEQMPQTHFILKDKNEGKEWVVLFGYDTCKIQREEDVQEDENYDADSFIFYNSFFVKKDHAEEFGNWVKRTDFTGRWLPEADGMWHTLWNEYPLQGNEEELWITDEEPLPTQVFLSSLSLLQEDDTGIEKQDNLSHNLFVPNPSVMSTLNLYTAERGLIRDQETEEVVAFNYNLFNSSLNVLVIERTSLNKFLESEGLVLFYCLLAEKTCRIGMTSLELKSMSAGFRYDKSVNPVSLQAMRIINLDK